jgi:hypothetical protein
MRKRKKKFMKKKKMKISLVVSGWFRVYRILNTLDSAAHP